MLYGLGTPSSSSIYIFDDDIFDDDDDEYAGEYDLASAVSVFVGFWNRFLLYQLDQ